MSKFETSFSGSISQGFHTAMVTESITIKRHGVDPDTLSFIRNRFADLGRCRNRPALL